MAVEPPFIADDRALDLLNTVLQADGRQIDLLQSDEDVARWLVKAGVAEVPTARKGLLKTARELREMVRELVRRRQSRQRLNLAPFNEFLAHARQSLLLVQDRTGALRLEQRFSAETPQEQLMPIALAAAELLASGDFSLVRECEAADCVLQFYDRTKSHRRRWCSMASCGNRAKVHSFRARLRGD